MTLQPWVLGLALLTAFLAAIGQLLVKLGSSLVSTSLTSWILNWKLAAGLGLHGLGFVALVIALKHGNLSVVYPVLATSYVWVALLSTRFLGEPTSLAQWLGVVLIVGGIALIVR